MERGKFWCCSRRTLVQSLEISVMRPIKLISGVRRTRRCVSGGGVPETIFFSRVKSGQNWPKLGDQILFWSAMPDGTNGAHASVSLSGGHPWARGKLACAPGGGIMGADGSDIVCAMCLSGEISEGNDILICDGDHSTTMGYHQQCCVPPVACIPDSFWFCPECSSKRRDVALELANPNYAPSSHPTTSSSSTCSTPSSACESDSNSNFDSSNDISSSDSDSSDMSSLTSASQSSMPAGGQGGALHLLNFFCCYGM